MKNKRSLLPKSIRTKMILAFCLPSILLFLVNFMLYMSTNDMINSLNDVYASNIKLNDLNATLTDLQASMSDYLHTRTTDSLEDYYRYEQDYYNMVSELDDRLVNSEAKHLERNIKNMSIKYLNLTNKTIDCKRGGNVEKYKGYYAKSTRMYNYISTSIYSLNNEQFVENSTSYATMINTLQSMAGIKVITLIVIGVGNLIFVVLFASTITEPLVSLSNQANKVSNGDFDIELIERISSDEIGVVTKAFNTMVISIREYIEKVKTSMEKERVLIENKLTMEAHLKDAKLRYLQAQINPHFLFNTLNAGAQLAMMEGAERTGDYIDKVAEFFRYNIKKDHDVVTLREEIELVDNYIYILNVRFSGDISFEKAIDESLLNIQIPSMILQPIVENSVNYGIRNIDWRGKIKLSVYRMENQACVSISDNGIGIEAATIEKILSGRFHSNDEMTDSNGVGLDNCINRLSLFYGRDDIMDIISAGKDKGTETILYLPLTGEDNV